MGPVSRPMAFLMLRVFQLTQAQTLPALVNGGKQLICSRYTLSHFMPAGPILESKARPVR